ncbi:MAG: YgjV family protein [Chitinophagaceae bacterium]|nr:YgjV family protein [Chitinophagaceae bacterium]
MLQQISPYFGYLASLCLIIALLVNNDLKFRWYNTLGNVFFITYAIILSAFPVLLTNLILLGINVYYLVKIYRRQENFDMLEFNGDEKLAQKFLQFYQKDIAAYFPEFKQESMQQNLNFVITRDLVIANMFSANISANGDATVSLNYTLEKYRDYKVGTYIFEKERDHLIEKGIQRIVYTKVVNKNHRQFLTVMGFKKEMIGRDEYFIKNLVTEL